jgi:hypothetical protein
VDRCISIVSAVGSRPTIEYGLLSRDDLRRDEMTLDETKTQFHDQEVEQKDNIYNNHFSFSSDVSTREETSNGF